MRFIVEKKNLLRISLNLKGEIIEAPKLRKGAEKEHK